MPPRVLLAVDRLVESNELGNGVAQAAEPVHAAHALKALADGGGEGEEPQDDG